MTEKRTHSSAATEHEPVLKKLRFTHSVMQRARMDGKSCLMSIWEQDIEGVAEAIEILSCGAESNRHSGAVGADKRAEQSNPGGGHEVTDRADMKHMDVEKPLPDEPTPAAGGLMNTVAQPTLESRVPLADHDDIGRKVLNQPWAVQSAIVTIAAHCTVIKDKCEEGNLADASDLAGCISQDLLELADFLASKSSPATTVETDAAKMCNSYLQRALDAEADALRLHKEKMDMYERAISAEGKLAAHNGLSAGNASALDNSQSLLAMIYQLGNIDTLGIPPFLWEGEELNDLLEKQIKENRAALNERQPSADTGRQRAIELLIKLQTIGNAEVYRLASEAQQMLELPISVSPQSAAMPKALDCMEYMPLKVRPLADDMDEGEHWVIDADNAYVFKLCCSHERAERMVAALNAAYSMTRPHGGGQ